MASLSKDGIAEGQEFRAKSLTDLYDYVLNEVQFENMPKLYKCRISQTGTAVPDITNVYNSFEDEVGFPEWVRTSVGIYTIKFNGDYFIDESKIFAPCFSFRNDDNVILYLTTNKVDNKTIQVDIVSTEGVHSDMHAANVPYEVRVYP